MNLWIDEHGIAGLTDNNGNQQLYLLPDEQMEMQTRIQLLIQQVSKSTREKYNENETKSPAKRGRIPSWKR